MADIKLDAKKAREAIIDTVNDKRKRKEVIRMSVEKLLGKEVVKDTSPSSAFNDACSMLGNIVETLIKDKILLQDEAGVLSVQGGAEESAPPAEKSGKSGRKGAAQAAKAPDKKAAANALAALDEKLTARITELARCGKYKKSELLARIKEEWTNTDKSDLDRVYTRAGQRVANMKKAGELLMDNNGCLHLPDQQDNERLFANIQSGEEFNAQTQRMLYEWYKKFGNLRDMESKNTDGTNDNGIDCYIKGRDAMGFDEYIIIQCKLRQNSKIYLKDMYEFGGIINFHLYGESRGKDRPTKFLYVTNTSLSPDAQRYVKAIAGRHMLKIIDGKEWLRLAEECGYKLAEHKG